MKKWHFERLLLVVACVWSLPSQAALIFDIGGLSFEGSNNIANDAVKVTFENLDSKTVQLLIDPGNLPLDASKLFQLYLNVNDSDLLGDLNFEYQSGREAETIQQGEDAFKADGDGKYDVLFTWPSSDDLAFKKTTTSVYEISLISGNDLSETFPDAWSAPQGGHGPFKAAVHIGEVATGQSGWYAPTSSSPPDPNTNSVPEPSALLIWSLLGILGIFLGLWKRQSA